MHDPFPFERPEYLVKYVQPVADALHLRTLPLHFHEVVFAFALYHFTNKYVSPAFSRHFFPNVYPQLNARTKVNWDVHIVSFVQSTVICGLALWVMLADEERDQMGKIERVHGYTGGTGLVQAFAGGYFLWDLMVTVQNISVFGIGMLFHAISALCVFSLGFRPFVNFYAPTFILYELSSPFLNIHWFCDKLSLTGSTLQLINGIFLLLTFMSCRLFWGTYQSIKVFGDIWTAYHAGPVTFLDSGVKSFDNATAIDAGPVERTDILQFADGHTVPLWIASAYLASNIVLNGLNWFWFTKMIETLRKRFDPPLGTRRAEKPTHIDIPENEKVLIEGIHVGTPGVGADGKVLVPEHYGVNGDGEVVKVEAKTTHLEVEGREDAAILLDEADIYVETHQTQDVARNNLVTSFLRAVEYYDGILCLTTNRIGTSDEAVWSRSHATIYYDNFTDTDRQKIWDIYFSKLEDERENESRVQESAKDYVKENKEVQSLQWNGREIRNAFQIAVNLAQAEDSRDKQGRFLVKKEHIKVTVDLLNDFSGYVDGLHKMSPSKRARINRTSDDDYTTAGDQQSEAY